MQQQEELAGSHHTYRRGYLTLPNETAWDQRLSYNALGVLAHLMARNPGGAMGYRALIRPGVGERSILGAFKELVGAGYRMQFRRQVQQPGKRPTMVTDTYHSEDPRPLEWYVAQHVKIYGSDPILVPSVMAHLEEAGKGTLASESVAHKSGALKRGARKRAAQQKAFQPLDKSEGNNQGVDVEDDDLEELGGPADPGQELLHCLGCDAVVKRMDTNERGQCDACSRLVPVVAQEPELDPAEAEAARVALFQASLERQAKRLHITVEQLLELRATAGHKTAAAVALGNKGSRSAPAMDNSGASQ